MRASAKLYFGKSKTPAQRFAVKGAHSVVEALNAITSMISSHENDRTTKAEILITVKARRSK